MSVKIVKLVNGIDVLGEIGKHVDYEHLIIVKNPVRIMVMPSKSDPKMPTVGFAPFNEFSDDKEVIFDSQHILCISTPISEFVNQYKAMFSGLVLPQSSSIIIP